jgi:hypothetical protein
LEAQHDVFFGDARLFQTFGDSQIGVVGLHIFPSMISRLTTVGVNAPRPVLIFPQNQAIIRPELWASQVAQPPLNPLSLARSFRYFGKYFNHRRS